MNMIFLRVNLSVVIFVFFLGVGVLGLDVLDFGFDIDVVFDVSVVVDLSIVGIVGK